METITLELTKAEAKVLINAWSLYGLIGLGAPKELVFLCLEATKEDFHRTDIRSHDAIESMSEKLHPILRQVQVQE